MPVIRKRETIRPRLSLSPVQAASNPMVDSIGNASRVLAEQAEAWGRIMAQESHDEGTALAKGVVFSLDENGIPQLPEDLEGRIGRIAERAYDGTVKERMAYQMQTAIRQMVRDAENANLNDYDAFLADATARLDGAAQNLPPELRGMFQQVSTSVVVDAGLAIGRRNAQTAEVASQNTVIAMAENTAKQVEQLIISGANGSMEAAEAVEADMIRQIEETPDYILPLSAKRELKQRLWAASSWGRMYNGLNLAELSSGELMDLRRRMENPQADDPIMEYWTLDGLVQFDLMEAAASKVTSLITHRNAQERADQAAQENIMHTRNVRLGRERKSARSTETLDFILGDQLDLGRRMVPEDWLTLDPETRVNALAQVKTSGYLPDSLTMLLREVENTKDPRKVKGIYDLLRDIRSSPNTTNEIVDMSGDIPEWLGMTFAIADAFVGSGDMSDVAMDRAVNMATKMTAEDSAWNPMVPSAQNDENLIQTFKASGILERPGLMQSIIQAAIPGGAVVGAQAARDFASGGLTKENIREKTRKLVYETVFAGIDATEPEKQRALLQFESLLAMNNDVETALKFTRQSMESNYAETKFFGNIKRSNLAPEIQYQAKGIEGFGDIAQRVGRWGKRSGLEVFETLFASQYSLAFGRYDLINTERLAASPFELMADAEIRELVAQSEELSALVGGIEFMQPGRDYVLSPDRSRGEPPVYRVAIKTPFGMQELPKRLDIRDRWADYKEVQDIEQQLEGLNDTREKKRIARKLTKLVKREKDAGRIPDMAQLFEEAREND